MLNDIVKTELQRNFVNDIISLLNDKNEITMSYKNFEFVVDPHGDKIEVYSNGENIGFYLNIDDFLLNHKIDGKALIDICEDVDYTI